MTEDQRKHFELIQEVINRMRTLSFFLKGWSVTLGSGILAVAAAGADRTFAWIAVVAAVVFWGLDAYYLRQEKLFRELYEDAIAGDTQVPSFSMDPTPYEEKVASVWAVGLTKTIWPIHGLVVFVALVVAVPATVVRLETLTSLRQAPTVSSGASAALRQRTGVVEQAVSHRAR